MDILAAQSNFRSLSVRDLLHARDLYHYHLLNKRNVVGTAIGLYLIRKEEEMPTHDKPAARIAAEGKLRDKGERTFQNSEVRDYSWPCVLVLVDEWLVQSDFGTQKKVHPDEMVPKTLYLPDGRMVPVCVVKVEPAAPDGSLLPEWHWPVGLYGGGMPIVVETQRRERRATAGCLVSDGHKMYALTSRHVCGDQSEPVYTLAGGQRVEIGRASGLALTRLPFEEVYADFPGSKTYCGLDVGLIELDDVNDWTSQVFGLKDVGSLADLNSVNITTRLIEARVVASGAASGRLEGRIMGLFYRYKSVGGYDHVADFLIAPEASSAQTRPGDSGTIWHLVTEVTDSADGEAEEGKTVLRPLATQWGGQVFMAGGGAGKFAFALATSLTNVCRLLDVELCPDHNTGALPYWGQVGHYSIAAFACDQLPNGPLRDLVSANLDRISFSIAELSPETISDRLKAAKENGDLVPLADVPDMVWKVHKTKMTGGRDDRWAGQGRSTGPEHPTHYADIDAPRPSDGKTLRELCLEDPANISVAFWQQFYADTAKTESRDRGLLPFRVWQFYEAMKTFATNGEPDKFLCAAGLVSHYVGDACQPLHGSMYADGYADQPVTIEHHKRDTGELYTEESHVGAGVHSTYETKMIDRYTPDILTGIEAALAAGLPAAPAVTSGQTAAAATIALMDRSATTLPPTDIVDTYIEAGGKAIAATRDALWETYSQQTMAIMADGARVLAQIWSAAWSAGNGNNIPQNQLGTIDTAVLKAFYEDETFVPSLDLDHVEGELG